MAENRDSMAVMATQICDKLRLVFTHLPREYPDPLSTIADEITAVVDRNGRVFVYGVGREGLMLKALCMRLYHLGLSAHCVGDVTTPPISSLDLLITSAGPGGFSTVDAISRVARSVGARVLLMTAQPETESSTRFATSVAYIPAKTMADDRDIELEECSLLPMGSLYEGAMFVLFEMVVFRVAEVLGQSPEAMRARHTNLE